MKIDQNELFELLEDLVGIRSVYFEEEKIIDFSLRWLGKRKVPAEIHHFEDNEITKFKGRNILGRIEGDGEGPTLLLNGHLDTVPLAEGWDFPPFIPTRKDGKLYGVGSLDMKAGTAAIMVAVKTFLSNHTSFNGNILYSLVSDEEGPYGLGTNYLIVDGLLDDADVAIVPEPSSAFTKIDFPCLCLGARGGYSFKVKFTGKAAHAANPEEGISAILDAGKVIEGLESIQLQNDDDFGTGSICVIDIKGGGTAASVADRAEFSVFRHIIPGETKQTIIDEINKVAKEKGVRSKYEIVFRKGPTVNSEGFMPYKTSKENPYTQKMLTSIHRATGKEPKIAYFNSIGDFCYIGSRLNIPTFIFGPGGANYHAANEYVKLDDVLDTAMVIYDYMEELLVT